jgi:hypothetical protein
MKKFSNSHIKRYIDSRILTNIGLLKFNRETEIEIESRTGLFV